MEKVLKLYKYIDGVNDTPFPNEEQQVITSDFRYDVKRMGGAPIITCTILHVLCLDKLWDESVYAYFNGERFFIKQVPTSSYAHTDSRYKHELELVSERVVLDNVYVYDVVDNSAFNDKPVSNNSKFAFFGTIHEFAERLNQSLQYSKLEYRVVVDDGISSEAMMVSFQDQFFSNAIQESYNTYNVPYYFEGKTIHFGYTNNAITRTFRYGKDESLLSIQKQNANYKIVNRVTGIGSADNIPYYYPNDYESKEEVEANGGTWVNPQPNLMPSIYRESLGNDRFYEALNNKYKIPDSNEYYEFANPYTDGNPKEHIVNFDNIKPTIKGVENASGYRIDMFSEFAYDANDNDEVDKDGNYLHPYFFAKLRKFDGEHGFNLFDHAIDEQEMTIAMTSGSCGSCEFVIGVDESTQKNTVQVDSNGYLERDDEGNVKFGTPQDEQNDTINNEVWIALRKDVDTFGVIMPNATNNYKPSINDTFVILHIDLPKAYIIAAEDRLKAQLIEYMSLNNSEKFNFSISFSRIFFAEYPDILAQLNENARIQIEYDNTDYELYISSYSYSMSSDKPLPEIRVELSDTLTISQNALQTAISEIKSEIISSGGSGNVRPNDILKLGLKYFLRKDTDDRSRGKVASDKGFEVGDYLPGELGIGGIFKIDENGDSYLEVDKALFRKIAYFVEIMIKKLSHVGGSIILSPASMKCSKVEEHGTYYRCYFENEKEGKTINQEFVVGDQARSQTFNIKEGLSQNVSNQYYWRLVVGVGKNYIDLSKADCDSGSGVPMVGDDIVLLGNRNNPERQNAIILSSYGEGTPSFRQYKKIHTYSMSDAELVTEFSPENNLITGKFISESGKNLEEEFLDAKVDWDKVLEQTDKEFSMWFFPYSPSADVVPEVDWVTPELKALHEEDLFYNTDDKSKDGGKAWRYTFKNGSYVWEIVTDAETIKALEKASNAQKTADEKIRNFITEDNVLPPPPYDKGDRWCNANFVEGNVIYAEDDDMVCITQKAKGEEPSINDWRHASAMNSETRHVYDAKIKNLGDSIQLTVEKTDQLAGDVSILAEELDGVSEQIRIYASKLSFDSNGNVTNISTSGLVTSSNYVSIFSQYKSQTGAVVQSEISAFVTENDVGEMISNITITADNVDINNGVVSIDKNSATIGGFVIGEDYIISTSDYKMSIINNDEGSGCIKWAVGDMLFARIGVWTVEGYRSGSLDVSNAIGESSTIIPARIRTSGQNFQAEMNVYNYIEGSFTIRKLGATGGQIASFGMDSNGRIRIGAALWPTSAQVNSGEIYNDGGTLKIKS